MAAGLFDLSGKVALVTGATRGLGFAMAQGLGEAGAEVLVNGRGAEGTAEAVETLVKAGVRARPAPFDVTDPAAAASAIAGLGPIDILVNNAGINRRAPFVGYSPEDWDAVIAINLTAPFRIAQAVVPGMIARGGGKIVNIGSLLSELGRPTVVPYAATKGGIRMLTRALATELAPHGIQVNAIGPGFFLTDMNAPLVSNPDFDAFVKRRTPAARWGRPEELAGAAVFLSSPASDFVTGQILYVDGGLTAAL